MALFEKVLCLFILYGFLVLKHDFMYTFGFSQNKKKRNTNNISDINIPRNIPRPKPVPSLHCWARIG